MVGKSGTLAIAILAGALAVAVALSVRLANQPPPAFPLPPSPVGDAAPADPADPGGPTKAELRESLEEGREAEAAPMARWPGVARREGDVLTIAADSRDLAGFTDAGYCDGFDQCSRWRFQGVMTLGGKAYPWLTLFQGEGEETAYLVTPGGGLIGAVGEPVASPDGRWLVVAFDDDDWGGGTTLFEVRPEGPVLVAGSDLACRAGDWPAGGRLSLICTLDDGKALRRVKAQLVGGEAGWRVRPTAELDPAGKKVLARPTAPLVEIAIPALKAENDGRADYEAGKGYRKLASPG
jgi:hypothetical protein